LNGRKPCIY